jgi:uncharacterized membrane protein
MKPEYALLIPLLIMGVFLQFTPLLTRRGIFFSATVDPAFPQSSDGRRLLGAYRLQAALWTIAAVGFALLLSSVNLAVMLLLSLLLLIMGSTFSYWLKFREVHEHFGKSARDVRYAELTPPPQQQTFSLSLCAPPFVWLAGVAFYLQSHWYQLPERFPVHWGVDGQPNGWATRSFQGVYGPLLLAAFMDVFFLGLALAMLRLSRNTAMRHVTVTMTLLIMYPVSFAFGMVGLLPLTTFPMWLIPAVVLGFVAVLIIWAAVKVRSPAAPDVIPEPQSDSYWKAGMFYYNPDDPAIFVSKRVGIGYTMNFANRMSWFVLAGILLIALLPALLLKPK